MEILIVIVVAAVLFFLYVQQRGKESAEYLGYYWDITAVKTEKKRAEKITIQSADVRQHLIQWCKSQEPIMLTIIETLQGNPMNWEMTKFYVKAAKHYKPGENNQAPEIMRYYAQLLAALEGEEWEIKSIEQSGWTEMRPDQR